MRTIRFIVILVLFLRSPGGYTQDQSIEGAIVEVSDNTVLVTFESVSLSVGDELRFVRRHEIIDPITNRVRGGRDVDIATGIVEDIGLESSVVSIIGQSQDINEILLTDKVFYTGRAKRVIRTREVVGTVQSLISENEIEIDVGADDEISEGDMFLIRRTENVYNPETNEVLETRSIDVGRGRVNSVDQGGSRASIVEFLPGLTVEERDEVVFEPEKPLPEPEPIAVIDSTEIIRLNGEIDALRAEVAMLRATVDSLGRMQQTIQQSISLPESISSEVLEKPVPGNRSSDRILERDDGDLPGNLPAELSAQYRQALDDCLGGQYDHAITRFTDILANYPDQPLAENCRYWIGQSRFSAGDLAGAAEQFRQVVVDTRFTHKDDDASIMLGITYYNMGQIPEALLEFESFLRRYPESEYRSRVQSWLDRLT